MRLHHCLDLRQVVAFNASRGIIRTVGMADRNNVLEEVKHRLHVLDGPNGLPYNRASFIIEAQSATPRTPGAAGKATDVNVQSLLGHHHISTTIITVCCACLEIPTKDVP